MIISRHESGKLRMPTLSLIVVSILVIGTAAAMLILRAGRYTPKVVLIGIDGADWRVIRPMIDEGDLPNLGRMVKEGASGDLTSYGVMMSPRIWNTIVTGKHYKEHGVDWFAVRMDDIGQRTFPDGKTPVTPITSGARKVPAIWDILGQAGATVGVIGYWATWPATEVNGYMVSDRFSYSRYNKLGGADQYLEHQTYPAELVEEIRGLVMSPGEVTDEDRRRFIKGDIGEIEWWVEHDIVGEFDITFSQMESYRRVGLHLLGKGQPDFFTVYFQGVDVTSHYFWEFMRPEQSGHDVSDGSIATFGEVIRDFYRYQDELIGEIMKRLDDNSVVIVASDHGFRDNPYQYRSIPHISGWHRMEGIIAIWGKGIRKGVALTDADVYDITPTILHLMKQPVGEDMPGRVLDEAFEEEILDEPIYVSSYGEMPPLPPLEKVQTPMDASMLERLKAIGYLDEGGGG